MQTSRVLLLLLCAACSKDNEKSGPAASSKPPALTAERVPKEAHGLMLGESTESDVNKAFDGLEWTKDKSFGGSGVVIFNGASAAEFKRADASGQLVDTGNGLRLVHLWLKAPGLCDFVKKTIASEEARRCPGNRKTGEAGSVSYYCLEANGRHVGVECARAETTGKDSLEYTLRWKD